LSRGGSRTRRAFREIVFEGFEILIGRGAEGNDALTFGAAEPLDLWLHVAGYPGSHVVIRNKDRLPELPPSVVEHAASLAAWHSKARGRKGKVEVHICRACDVTKPRGYEPGEVLLRSFRALRVYAVDPADPSRP